MVQVLEPQANMLGMSFPAYVKYLLTKEMESVFDNEEEMITDPKIIADIKESLDDYKNGRYTTMNSKKEIKEHFESLLRDENS